MYMFICMYIGLMEMINRLLYVSIYSRYVLICTYVYLCMYMYVCIYIYMCACVCVYIYIYMGY